MITKEEIERSVRGQKAKEHFTSGYNCTQSVLLAFEDYIEGKGLDPKTVLRMASPMGIILPLTIRELPWNSSFRLACSDLKNGRMSIKYVAGSILLRQGRGIIDICQYPLIMAISPGPFQ